MSNTIPCTHCGLPTASPTGICHRHGSNKASHKGGVAPSRIPPLAVKMHQQLASEYEDIDGVISPERVRRYAVKQMREHTINATDWVIVQELDVLDPEDRNTRIAEYLQWHRGIKIEQDTTEELYQAAKASSPEEGRKRLVRGMFMQRHILGKEWELGKAMNETSPEGVHYGSVSRVEFVNYISKELAKDRDRTIRKHLRDFHEIIQSGLGRPARNSSPIDSRFVLDEVVVDPMIEGNDYASSEEEELEIIRAAEAEIQREHQAMLAEQEQIKAEKRLRRMEGVVNFAKDFASNYSAEREASKERERIQAMQPDQEYQQAVINQERRRRDREWRKSVGLG